MSEHPVQGEINALAPSGLFDGAWYLAQNDDVASRDLAPLPHFCLYGWREGRNPNPHFDIKWYLQQYPDVLDAGLNPLLHYLRYGDRDGRQPVWYFDPKWYRAAYDLPPDANALAHFLVMRTTGRFAPTPELYAVLHLAPYRDDAATADDPFIHYFNDVRRDGRDPFPDIEVVTASGLIDANYYLINGSDVHEANLDPIAHFCRYGWREGRKPNIYFDVNWYLQTNPDVARLRINPVMHYALVGEPANRRPVPYFDPGWYRSTYAIEPGQNALAHFLKHRRSQAFSPTPLFDVAWYVARHAEELGRNRDPFAHYLQVGTYRAIDPSQDFDAEAYRQQHLGRPSRQFRQLMRPEDDNPLVHYLRARYR